MIELIQKQTKQNLIKIGLFLKESKGYPLELFIIDINERLVNDEQRLRYVLGFYEENKKWCDKNGVVVENTFVV